MKLSPKEQIIHAQFSEYGSCAKQWMRKCVTLLPLIQRYEIWDKKGFSSVYEYAAKLAGMSRNSVDAALWTMKKIEDKPVLQKLVEEVGLGKIRIVAKLATPETQDFWAEKAKIMSQHTLETYVKEMRESCRATKTEPDGLDVTLHLKADLGRRLEGLRKHVKFEEKLAHFVDEMEKEILNEQPSAVLTPSRHIPMQIQRHVQARTNGLCAYPGCDKQASSLHHTQRWKSERVHDPARLHALCTAHERLAHLGLIENEENSPSEWRLKKERDPTDLNQYVDRFVALYRGG